MGLDWVGIILRTRQLFLALMFQLAKFSAKMPSVNSYYISHLAIDDSAGGRSVGANAKGGCPAGLVR